jgi:cytochrome c-type biogenesis protein CcmH/NrfF
MMLAATPIARAQSQPSQHSGTGTVHIESDEERAVFERLRCMCGGCARELLSTCPCDSFAAPARERIRAKMRAGETRDQIIAEYVAEWGQDSIAIPPNRGVLKAIYVVPVIGIALAAAGLAAAMRRWKGEAIPGDTKGGKGNPGGRGPDPYDARLDDELKDLDG